MWRNVTDKTNAKRLSTTKNYRIPREFKKMGEYHEETLEELANPTDSRTATAHTKNLQELVGIPYVILELGTTRKIYSTMMNI